MDVALASAAPPESDQTRLRNSSYRPDIDGLRAVAILAVVGFHAFARYIPGGYAGVDIFFVISGFLISGIIVRDLQRGKFSSAEFYIRRIKRIFPALVLMLITVWGVGWLILLPDDYQALGKDILAGAGFATNLSLYEDYEWYFGLGTNPLVHLWSLGIEEQFYLLWPVLLLIVWKLTDRRLLWICAITLTSFALSVIASRSDPNGCFYLPWNRLWELSSGAVLACAQVAPAPQTRYLKMLRRALPWSRPILTASVRGVLGAALIVGSIVVLDDRIVFPGWWALAPSSGALLLISAGRASWINARLLSTRTMVFIGLISYPLYLWHWPVLVFARVLGGSGMTIWISVAALLIATVLAIVTYQYFELPLRHSPNRRLVVAGLSVSMAICAVLGLMVFTQELRPRSESDIVEKFVRAATEDWLPNGASTAGARYVRWAHWTVALDRPVKVGAAPRQVVFIGDSNMQQYYLRITRLLAEHPQNSHSAIVAVGSGCAPAVMEMLRFQVPIPNVSLAPCRKTVQQGLAYARSPSVDTVVLGAHWYRYLVDLTDGGRFSTDAVLGDLRRMIAGFIKDGKRVYIVLNIPRGNEFDPRQMVQWTLLSPGFRISIHNAGTADIIKLVGPADDRIREVAQSTGAVVIDPLEFLCNSTVCPAISPGGDPMYKDGSHLRPSYVRDHVQFLDQTILDVDGKAAAQPSLDAISPDPRRRVPLLSECCKSRGTASLPQFDGLQSKDVLRDSSNRFPALRTASSPR
jgi:peptidoglycan/LPS O-acetylase OafA/YrhL